MEAVKAPLKVRERSSALDQGQGDQPDRRRQQRGPCQVRAPLGLLVLAFRDDPRR
jgi:hypothetical protein